MKVSEAIELLETWQKQTHGRLISDYKDAVQLCIEALKSYQKTRSDHPTFVPRLLPGETEE